MTPLTGTSMTDTSSPDLAPSARLRELWRPYPQKEAAAAAPTRMSQSITARASGGCGTQLAQVVLCKGCCCGQTDRGRPPVPIDEMKAIWKAERLNRSVQLSLSGCLGPCKLANVVLLITPEHMVWLGGLSTGLEYAALVAWALESRDAGRVMPLPILLEHARFARF